MAQFEVGDVAVVVGNASFHIYPIGTPVVITEVYANLSPIRYLTDAQNGFTKNWYLVEWDLEPKAPTKRKGFR
jgi:hypothetical protein